MLSPGISEVSGVVFASEPIQFAEVALWEIGPDGTVARYPAYTGETDELGRIKLEIPDLVGPFLMTAAGGVTAEYWTGNHLELDSVVHVRAVVTSHVPGQEHHIVITPLTTIATARGEKRGTVRAPGNPYITDDIRDVDIDEVELAYERLGSHFGFDPLHTVPDAPESHGSLSDSNKYGLVLAGMSSLAWDIADESRMTGLAWNTLTFMAALMEDARDDARFFDGIGPDGPIAVGACEPECLLGANMLRARMAQALTRWFSLMHEGRSLLDSERALFMIMQMTGNRDPLLFGDTPIEPFDDEGPEIRVVTSPVYDESQDRIDFTSGREPVHVHDGARIIDLARGYRGICPVVYKHVSLLHDPEENPLRWLFEVRDDLAGVDPMTVDYRVGIAGNGPDGQPGWVSDWRRAEMIGWAENRTAQMALTLLADDIPELATTEAVFVLEIRAEDLVGEVSPAASGCWQHVPLGPPLWVGPPGDTVGPGSLQATRLEANNLAPLLNGMVPEGKVLAAFEIYNGTFDPAFVTLQYDQPLGSYQGEWARGATFIAELGIDGCLQTGLCSAGLPADPELSAIGPYPLPPLVSGIRVVEKNSGIELPCSECDSGEFMIEGGRAYEVQILVDDMGFLLPVPVEQVAELVVGVGNPGFLTGVLGDVEERCYWEESLQECQEHIRYQLYQALTAVDMDIRGLVVRGRVSPSVALPPRIPNPSASSERTLMEPIRMDITWTTVEPGLPDTNPPSQQNN